MKRKSTSASKVPRTPPVKKQSPKTKIVNLPEVPNPEGRPRIFNSPEEMELKIQEYFNNCPDKRTVVMGNGTIELPAITITGLCIFLGFESRQSFYDYEKQDEYSYIIKKARLRVENYYEKCLQFGNVTGAIFPLKNMGWSDKTELEHTGIPEQLTMTIKVIRNGSGD